MNDAGVEIPFDGQYRYRTLENRIESPMVFVAPKGGIDPGVVNFLFPLHVLFDGQFFPLKAEVQELQNVVEGRVQGELWLGATTPYVQMGQDKFLKLF
jgi:hypothetical protein